jgi:hypothetical protein
VWEAPFGLQEAVPLSVLCVKIASIPGMFSHKTPSLALRHEVLLFYLIRRGEQIKVMTAGANSVSSTECWPLQVRQARLSLVQASSR